MAGIPTDAGLYAHIVARREAVIVMNPHLRDRIMGRKPTPIAGKAHRIFVDLRTGERTVEIVDPIDFAISPALRPAPIFVLPVRRAHRRVIEAACNAWGVLPEGLMSINRDQKVVQPRFACWLFMYRHMHMSTNQIGRAFKRDHTTVMSGLKRARELLRHPKWQTRYDVMLATLRSHA